MVVISNLLEREIIFFATVSLQSYPSSLKLNEIKFLATFNPYNSPKTSTISFEPLVL